MTKEPEIVVVYKARSQAIAENIAEALKSEGIPAHVEGTVLQDEFAVSQKTLGLVSVNVLVHRDRLQEALEVLSAMREAGKVLEEEGAGGEEPGES